MLWWAALGGLLLLGGLSPFLFAFGCICYLLLAIYLALDAHARDTDQLNLFGSKRLFELNHPLWLLSSKDIPNLISQNKHNDIFAFRKQKSSSQRHGQGSAFEFKNDIYTGNAKVDEQVRDIVNLILRDYVYSWYSALSHNHEFVNELRILLQVIIQCVAARLSSIERVHFITKKLVDHFAFHLHLFRTAEHYLKFQKIEETSSNLVSVFFDLELQSQKNFCREAVCTKPDHQAEYFLEIVHLVEYLLLPPEIFAIRPIRYFLRDLLVNSVLCPIFELVSDPDFLNQSVVKFCREVRYTLPLSQSFLMVVRSSQSIDELYAIKEQLDKEMDLQRSKDIGGDDDFEIRQQISSLQYVQSLILSRVNCLKEGGNSPESPANVNEISNFTNTSKCFQIPFEVVLKNNVALSYFFEYMSSVKGQSYLYFYLNVEGFKLSAEQHLSEMSIQRSAHKINVPSVQMLREAALSIFETYLDPESDHSHRLAIDSKIVRNIRTRIDTESLDDSWFDEAQQKVYTKMCNEESFYPSFKKSIHYVKLLAELDLLKETNTEIQQAQSSQNFSSEKTIYKRSTSTDKLINNDCDDSSSIASCNSYDTESITSLDFQNVESTSPPPLPVQLSPEEISAEIVSTGITKEFGHTFGVYCLNVIKRDLRNSLSMKEDKWCIIRRYSDFYTFHQQTVKLFPQLNKFGIPGKRPFNNVSQEFLNARKLHLNSYLQNLLKLYNQPHYEAYYKFNRTKFREHLFSFLDNGTAQAKQSAPQLLQRTVSNVLNPFKTAMKAGQENLLDTFNKIKSLQKPASELGHSSPITIQKQTSRTECSPTIPAIRSNLNLPHVSSANQNMTSSSAQCKLSSLNLEQFANQADAGGRILLQLDAEEASSTNIPLRILLLLMDEIFELKCKNFWLRRRIIAVIKQIIQTAYGGAINRKIIHFIHKMFGMSAMADYLRSIKKALWPNGYRALPNPQRSDRIKHNTRCAAKMLLLSSFPDDLKHIIGTETSRRGLLTLFNMFQYGELNRRLLLIIFESLLLEMFPHSDFKQVFQRIHSCACSKNYSKADCNTKNQWPPYLTKDSPSHTATSTQSSSQSSAKSSPLKKKK